MYTLRIGKNSSDDRTVVLETTGKPAEDEAEGVKTLTTWDELVSQIGELEQDCLAKIELVFDYAVA